MRVSSAAKVKLLFAVRPGDFLVDSNGAFGQAVLWEGGTPTAKGCCYVPLTGPNAFELAWTNAPISQHVPSVLEVGTLAVHLRFDVLEAGTFRYQQDNVHMATKGDLLFTEKGAGICVSNQSADGVVWIAKGEIETLNPCRVLVAKVWTLSAALDGEEAFTVSRAGPG